MSMTQTQSPQSAYQGGFQQFEPQLYPQTAQTPQQHPYMQIPQQLAQHFVPAQIAQQFVPQSVAQQFVPKHIAQQYVPPQIAQQIAFEVLRTQAMAVQALQNQQQFHTPQQQGQSYNPQSPLGGGLPYGQQNPNTQQWAGQWPQQQNPSALAQYFQRSDSSPFGQIRPVFPQF